MANGHVTIFVIFWLYQIVSSHLVIQQPSLELTYDVTEYNHCLVDGFKLQQYVGRQLDDCVTECAIRSHCKALTYHRLGGASSLCELFQSEGGENVSPTGCVYIERKDITIEKMSCNAECEYGTTCNMTTAVCEHTECASLPNITNGRILGKLSAAGKKIQFKCDIGISTDKDAVCLSDGNWSVSTVDCIHTPAVDCKDLYDIGNHDSGVYRIFPVGSGTEGIEVRCDMTTPPGGWTIIQRRIDDTDFYKAWSEYRKGFGDLSGSYWLGNDYIWKLTSSKPYRLRIDLTAQDGMTGYAEYDDFSIEDETLQYALNIGSFHGDVGNSLSYHNQMKFTTMDMDNDYDDTKNCAAGYHGAWWYNICHHSNLNGEYMNSAEGMGLNWVSWRGHRESLEETEMKIHPA